MSEFLYALSWILAANLWVAFGCVVLVVAIDKAVVGRPQSVIHSIAWMCLWPLLVLKGVMTLFRRRRTAAMPAPPPHNTPGYNQSNSVN